ncbi:MAG: hypothetical protein A3G84_01235 [Chloroflexi bacterium RIFCSPLOWO2_12_FULL_71_12]|nr:MAG: hypothetical protein A3G84_01235 [Chloroflexi bacterium RIFCSPLOWO2_12_FULL_71_12]
MTVFTAVLVFALGLVAWAASERYYEENLAPAASIEGRVIPKRDFLEQRDYELVRFYQDFGVPPGFENDPQLLSQKAAYDDVALDVLIEQRILELEARAAGYQPSAADVERQYEVQFGQFNVRHILIQVPTDEADQELADLNGAARARAVLNELKAAPQDQALWNDLAAQYSDDPGSKFSGGDLGFASSGQYVAEFEDAIRTLEVGQLSDLVKTQFGYHIIQLRERKPPAENELVKRYLTSGFTEADLRAQARYTAMGREFERRARSESVTSPTEQVHVAKIVVNVPLPTVEGFEQFTEALQKQTDVRTGLEQGKDFAELAKQYSEDSATKEAGGDAGWVARGMTVDPASEEAIFSTAVGSNTTGVTTGSQWTVYRVLEKEASRELDAEQKKTISDSAYGYWLERTKRERGVTKHILGF